MHADFKNPETPKGGRGKGKPPTIPTPERPPQSVRLRPLAPFLPASEQAPYAQSPKQTHAHGVNSPMVHAWVAPTP